MGTLTNSQSIIFGDSNWKFYYVGYPVGTLTKPDIQRRTFPISDYFLCFKFWVKKIKTCWIHKNNVFANWEKYKASWKFDLVFIIDFKSCIPGSFHTVTSLRMGFYRERAAAGLRPSGLNHNRHSFHQSIYHRNKASQNPTPTSIPITISTIKLYSYQHSYHNINY